MREALVDAALQLIAERGAQALSLREVARRAGVSHNAPYRHFADREALLAAVAEEGFRALDARLASAARGHPADARAAFQAQGVAYVRFALDRPSHFRVMFGGQIEDPQVHPGLVEAGTAAYQRLVDGVARCQEAGVMRAGDTETLSLFAWSTVHGLSSLILDRQVPLDTAAAEAITVAMTNEMWQGVAAR